MSRAGGLARGLPPPLRADPHPGLLRASIHGLYDLLWYGAALAALPWLLVRSLRDRAFRAMLAERLGWHPPPRQVRPAPVVLVHGVSVGEVKGALPLVRGIEERFPGLEVVVSATTNTGIGVARELFPGRRVVRFPADTSRAVRRFLERVGAGFVVLVELEVWPNFLRECNRRGAPVVVVNGRITEASHGRYLVFRKLLPQFNRLSLLCVQDEGYARRFRDLWVSPERVVVTGSLKADRLSLGAAEPGAELRALLGAPAGVPVIVAGSTHEPEEALVAKAWRSGAPGTRLLIVPRHPGRAAEIARELGQAGERVQRLTELRAQAEPPDPARPCVVDTMGELERVYGLADVVFVGGSLIPHGGQNMLEPAAQGKAVIFGPHVENFAREAELLVSSGACVQVRDAEHLACAFGELLAAPERRARMAELGLEVVRTQKGATKRTLDALAALGLGAEVR